MTEEEKTLARAEYERTHANELQLLQFAMKLNGGSIHFAYRKNNGELRIAHGTQSLELVPKESHPKGTGYGPVHYTVYWDFRSNGWRAASLSEIVWIDGIYKAVPGVLTEADENALVEYKKENGLV